MLEKALNDINSKICCCTKDYYFIQLRFQQDKAPNISTSK